MTIIRVQDIEIRVENKRTFGGKGDYVGRPTILGNPFPVGGSFTRDGAIDQYRVWLKERVEAGDTKICRAIDRLRQKAIREKQLTLLCWCSPLRCHADVIADMIVKAIAGGTTFGGWMKEKAGDSKE